MLRIERSSPIIHVYGEGLHTLTDVECHFAQLPAIIDRHRCAGVIIRALIDLRASQTQPADVATSIAERTSDLFWNDTDLVAIIVSSSLLKGQLKRIHAAQSFGVFRSPAAALQFLGLANDGSTLRD